MAMRISRILHAGYVFESEGSRVVFDPIFENPFSVNCHAFPSVRFDREGIRRQRFDAVFISHFHDDHCSLESLDLIDRATPIYAYCLFDELFGWLREMGFRDVHSLEIGMPVTVGAFTITPRKALDAEVDSIFHIQAAGLNVLNVVDAWLDPATLPFLTREDWDLILWPFQTMRELAILDPRRATEASRSVPPEWLEQLRALQPRYVVPSSCQFIQEEWSWQRKVFFPISYARFREEVEAALPGARVVRMNPSVSMTLTAESIEAAPALEWVIPVGEQDVDYEFDTTPMAPPTAEIARRFPALGTEQRESIRHYCREELPRRFGALPAAEESYFASPKIWRLSTYDHLGEAEHFHYRIEGTCLEAAASPPTHIDWLTEIPMARLLGALESGETLTSLYVRINDHGFVPETEAALQAADLLADPLVRALFEGAFASYQTAQLRRFSSRRTGP